MFSFFKTKKTTPPSSPDSNPIPSGSDFVVVDPKPSGPYPYPPYPYPNPIINPNPNQNPTPLYPNFGNHFGHPSGFPPIPAPRPTLQHSDSIQYSYLSGVPFKLSPQISTGDTDEITKIQVDGILALITSKMDVTQLDYDFTLERSLLQQNEAESTEAKSTEAESTETAEE